MNKRLFMHVHVSKYFIPLKKNKKQKKKNPHKTSSFIVCVRLCSLSKQIHFGNFLFQFIASMGFPTLKKIFNESFNDAKYRF